MRGLLYKRSRRDDNHEENLGTDRLSDLPDELLLLIISSITVKEAVRTIVLSSRWRGLHTLLPRIYNLLFDPLSIKLQRFSCSNILPTKQLRIKKKWAKAVDRYLSSYWGLIRRCIIWNPLAFKGSRRYYDRWIEDLMGKGIEELKLKNTKASMTIVPSRLLSSKSLTVLDLEMCKIPVCDVGCINLRTLRLRQVTLSESLLRNIISTCHKLERLHILHCGEDFSSCSINDSSLKHLSLQLKSMVMSIDVDARNLQNLTLSTLPPPLKNLNLDLHGPEIRDVCIDLTLPRIELATRLKRFLAATAELTSLTLSGDSVLYLSQGEPEGFPIPFRMLKTLSINVDLMHEQQALFIVELLESCPQLQQLNLSIHEWHGLGSPVQLSKHGERLQQLQCFAHHLEQVKISGFRVLAYRMKLARLILRDAKVLKEMTLRLQSWCSYSDLTAIKGLLSLKGASTQLILISHTNYPIQLL